MRIIVLGVGAIGGIVAAALADAGKEVIGIARGAQLAAINERGLKVITPNGTRVSRFPCVPTPDEIDWRPDDAILLCTKTQHTPAALEQLAAAGVTDQPIFCFQNGVENERLALRLFPNVHGVTVMLPSEYMTPGEVVDFAQPKPGYFDIGRIPQGLDAADEALCALLDEVGFSCFAHERVMESKHGKLLLNLGNMTEAAFGKGEDEQRIVAALRDEAKAVYDGAGIAYELVGAVNSRHEELTIVEIEGVNRVGSSSTQSIARGAGSVETDFLNGEIALQARLHGLLAPGNAYMTALAARMIRDGIEPGSVAPDEILTLLNL